MRLDGSRPLTTDVPFAVIAVPFRRGIGAKRGIFVPNPFHSPLFIQGTCRFPGFSGFPFTLKCFKTRPKNQAVNYSGQVGSAGRRAFANFGSRALEK
jgi:hypothetical protein